MTIHTESLTERLATEGRVETAVIGVRYVGDRSSKDPAVLRRQGGWPGDAPFQGGPVDPETGRREPGPIQVGINPDWIDDDTVEGGTLAGIEAHGEFEVLYEPAAIAAALLERNFLPPRAFGGDGVSYEPRVREALFDALGLEDVGTCPAAASDYRAQLATIAGVDDADPEASPVDDQRKQTLLADHTRQELSDAAKIVRTDTDEVDLRGAGKHDIAAYLAAQDDQTAVTEALKEVA
jgi:hypothetical protein